MMESHLFVGTAQENGRSTNNMKLIIARIACSLAFIFCLVESIYISMLFIRTKYGFATTSIGMDTACLVYIVGACAIAGSFAARYSKEFSNRAKTISLLTSIILVIMFTLLIFLNRVVLY